MLLTRFHQFLADNAVAAAYKERRNHYRRIMVQKLRRRLPEDAILTTPAGRGFGIGDGNGIVFISHAGQVFPSGFLPLGAGNVRKTPLADIYRGSRATKRCRRRWRSKKQQ